MVAFSKRGIIWISKFPVKELKKAENQKRKIELLYEQIAKI